MRKIKDEMMEKTREITRPPDKRIIIEIDDLFAHLEGEGNTYEYEEIMSMKKVNGNLMGENWEITRPPDIETKFKSDPLPEMPGELDNLLKTERVWNLFINRFF